MITDHEWLHGVLRGVISFVLFCAFACAVMGQNAPPASQTQSKDVSQMSIEDLMNLEVTSGAKKEEPLQKTAAALFVITSEDIRRSGATTIPDVLRMVPGVDVAQINGSVWAISARGFNDQFSNKMLVLVDGRTVYSPVFSGVFWDVQDMLLADIDRIEVIRGPGAALWGSNAVNGVINIISKTAAQTQGVIISGAGGNVEGGYGSVQYGGKLGSNGFFRVFTKGFSKDSVAGLQGQGPQDGWNLEHAGFRADWTLRKRDSVTVQGDLLQSFAQGTTDFTTSLAPLVFGLQSGQRHAGAGNLLGRWRRTLSPRSDFTLQAYVDLTRTSVSAIDLDVTTMDIEFQHHLAAGKRHDIVWGVDFRTLVIQTEGTTAVSFTPAHTTEYLGAGFIQDEIELVPSILRLTLGARLQQDYATGLEFQPDVRLLWTPRPSHSIWLAASRAYRGLTPTDTGVRVLLAPVPSGTGLNVVPESLGNPNLSAEASVALQAGYRAKITHTISADVATFYTVYKQLRGQDTGSPILETESGTPFLLLPETFNNKVSGEAHGIELSMTWRPISSWKITGGYTWFAGNFNDRSIGPSANAATVIDQDPKHQFNIRSSLDLPHRFEFDAALYSVGHVETPVPINAYYRVDARLGWHVGSHTEISVVGQNLLTPHHFEFNNPNDLVEASEVRRSFYGKVTLRFGEAAPK